MRYVEVVGYRVFANQIKLSHLHRALGLMNIGESQTIHLRLGDPHLMFARKKPAELHE